MSDITIDASELTAFGRRVASAHAKASIAVAKAVKKGAQNVKESIQEDVAGSGNVLLNGLLDVLRALPHRLRDRYGGFGVGGGDP
ncbi:hypothetical protein BLOI2_0437, partial [Bifidobacterium longum subsp. longum]